MSQKRPPLDAAADWIFGAAVDVVLKADVFYLYLGNFLLAHDSRDYCAHQMCKLLQTDVHTRTHMYTLLGYGFDQTEKE